MAGITMKTAWIGLVIVIGALVQIGCGGSRISEKSIDKSSRFYEAASVAWYEEKNTLLAIRNLERSLEANPENDEAHYLLGIIRFAREEYDEAEKHLAETIRLREANNDRSGKAGAENNLGLLYIHRKNYAKAIELLKSSVGEVMNREPWLAMGNLGWAYIEIGDYDAAVESLRRAVFEQPAYCVGLYRLGQVSYLRKDYEKSVIYLKQAIETPQPGCDQLQEAYRYLGMSLLRVEQDKAAVNAFRRCVEIDRVSDAGIECARILEGF